MTKAAEVYAIPSLRRQIVSYLLDSSLKTSMRSCRSLMREAAVFLYGSTTAARLLNTISKCPSPVSNGTSCTAEEQS
jgi:hypothetical protein